MKFDSAKRTCTMFQVLTIIYWGVVKGGRAFKPALFHIHHVPCPKFSSYLTIVSSVGRRGREGGELVNVLFYLFIYKLNELVFRVI